MSVVDHPASNEIIIVCIQLVLAKPPFLIREAIGEIDILQDACPVGTGAPRHARHATIHMGHRSTVEVPALQVECSEEVVDALGEGWILCPSQSLASDHTTVLLLLERSQKPW